MSDDLTELLRLRPLLSLWNPVDPTTGILTRREPELRLDDDPPAAFDRTYLSSDTERRGQPFGIGGNHSFGSYLMGDAKNFSFLELILDDGTWVHFRRTSPGKNFVDGVFIDDGSQDRYRNSRISWKDGGWLLELADGTRYRHPSCSPSATVPCRMSGFLDRDGREIKMTFAKGTLARLETPHHRFITLDYDHDNRIVRARDDAGHVIDYEYDGKGRLTGASSSDGTVRRYEYNADNRLIRASTPDEIDSITYDKNGRCASWAFERVVYVDPAGHTFKRSGRVHFSYDLPASTDPFVSARAVTVTFGRETRRVTFDTAGKTVREVYAGGQALDQTTAFERDDRTSEVRRIRVTCGGTVGTTIEESVDQGADLWQATVRARIDCDGKSIRIVTSDISR